jgi:hypothetical protein
MNHRYTVGDALDLVYQMRRQQHGAALLGYRTNDRAEYVTANDGIEAAGGLVEQQQIRTVRQRNQQGGAGTLAVLIF